MPPDTNDQQEQNPVPPTSPFPEAAEQTPPQPEPVVPQEPVVSSPMVDPSSQPVIPSVQPITSEPIAQQPISPTTPPPQTSNIGNKLKSMKWLLIALVAIVVIGGGTAAAYVGFIVPNRPANVLQKAVENSLQQTQVSYTGNLSINSTDESSIPAFSANINGSTNETAKATDLQLSLSTSGISFPVELRLVNQNIYVKFGDLSSVASELNKLSPGIGPVAQEVSSEISNKWIEIDNSTLQQEGLSCELNASWQLTQSDLKLLENSYQKNPFVTIQSTQNQTLNGQSVEEFQLNINDDKAATFSNSLNQLSVVKNINSCDNSASPTTISTKGDGSTTPLTVWVNKKTHEIAQISAQSTAAEQKNDDLNAKGTVSLTYGSANISAPQNSVPIDQILNTIEQALVNNPNALGIYHFFLNQKLFKL